MCSSLLLLSTFSLLLLLNHVLCMPHFTELDEEEKQLYRAAYDTPSYDQDYDEDVDSVGILGPKEALWMMKAKLKEVKEFMRALSANLLSTKLKIKELTNKHKLNFHKYNDNKKPSYNYQPHQHHVPPMPYEPTQYGHDVHYNY